MTTTDSAADPRARLRPLITMVAVLISLAHIYFNTISTLPTLWISAMHFAGLGFLGALVMPLARPRTTGGRAAVLAVDVVIALLSLLTAAYLMLFEQALYDRGQNFIWSDWVVSIIAVVLAIEFARRTTGWIIPGLIIIALTYVGWWGRYAPGVFEFPGLSWEIV